MALKPFAKEADVKSQQAASEVQPVEIPFEHSAYLGEEYSKGITNRCFFLKSKITGEIVPWNSFNAEFGNIYWLPHFDLDLLNAPDFASTVEVWRKQGVLPAGYGGTTAKNTAKGLSFTELPADPAQVAEDAPKKTWSRAKKVVTDDADSAVA